MDDGDLIKDTDPKDIKLRQYIKINYVWLMMNWIAIIVVQPHLTIFYYTCYMLGNKLFMVARITWLVYIANGLTYFLTFFPK